MAMPARVKRSNIHFSASPGRPGSVGAYQTQGIGPLVDLAGGKITNAAWPCTEKLSPGSGKAFWGASAAKDAHVQSRKAVPRASGGFIVRNGFKCVATFYAAPPGTPNLL